MNSNSKTRTNSTLEKAQSRGDFVPWWIRLIVDFIYEYSFVWIGAIIVLFIVIIISGDLFTRNGFLLALANIVFIILFILQYLRQIEVKK